MNTNKLNKIAYLALIILVSLSLNSCSSDDDKDNTPSSNDKLNFAGLWENESINERYRDYFFFEDGKVVVSNLSSEDYGSWTYNESTEILATSLNYQWQITLKTDNEWSGICLHRDDRRSVSYIRSNDYEKQAIIILGLSKGTGWESKNGETLIFRYFEGTPELVIKGEHKHDETFGIERVLYDKKKDVMTILTYRSFQKIEIYNPYSYNKGMISLHWGSDNGLYDYSGEFTRIKIK